MMLYAWVMDLEITLVQVTSKDRYAKYLRTGQLQYFQLLSEVPIFMILKYLNVSTFNFYQKYQYL